MASFLWHFQNQQEYYEQTIVPLIEAHPGMVEFIGEIGDAEKGPFLGNAKALLFPIEWAEPFGLVMIEAMACGTPVLAKRVGSVPEVGRFFPSIFWLNIVKKYIIWLWLENINFTE